MTAYLLRLPCTSLNAKGAFIELTDLLPQNRPTAEAEQWLSAYIYVNMATRRGNSLPMAVTSQLLSNPDKSRSSKHCKQQRLWWEAP